jgi:hypothetical protein
LTINFFILIKLHVFYRRKGKLMKTQVPFFDLSVQFKSIEEEIKEAIDEVFQSKQFIMGPQVQALEKTIAQYCRTPHAMGVASGSDALLLSLMAAGIGLEWGNDLRGQIAGLFPVALSALSRAATHRAIPDPRFRRSVCSLSFLRCSQEAMLVQ